MQIKKVIEEIWQRSFFGPQILGHPAADEGMPPFAVAGVIRGDR